MANFKGLTINGGATGYVRVAGTANLVLEDFDDLLALLKEEYKAAKKERIAELEKRIADTKATVDKLKAELDALKAS